eukprot:7336257-Prymnesium_polylepis.3
MVVIEGQDDGRPALFGVLHAGEEPIATLRIHAYSWWTLGATCIHSVASSGHERLVGKWFVSLASAAQHGYQSAGFGQTTSLFSRRATR